MDVWRGATKTGVGLDPMGLEVSELAFVEYGPWGQVKPLGASGGWGKHLP